VRLRRSDRVELYNASGQDAYDKRTLAIGPQRDAVEITTHATTVATYGDVTYADRGPTTVRGEHVRESSRQQRSSGGDVTHHELSSDGG